jgi:hypothetical protein
VRAALVWAGLPDPALTRFSLQGGDPGAEAAVVLMDCWERMDPDRKGLLAAEVTDTLNRRDKASKPEPWHFDIMVRGSAP